MRSPTHSHRDKEDSVSDVNEVLHTGVKIKNGDKRSVFTVSPSKTQETCNLIDALERAADDNFGSDLPLPILDNSYQSDVDISNDDIKEIPTTLPDVIDGTPRSLRRTLNKFLRGLYRTINPNKSISETSSIASAPNTPNRL